MIEEAKMKSSTIKPRARCSGGCIPDTSGYRCAYCHFELSPNIAMINIVKKDKQEVSA